MFSDRQAWDNSVDPDETLQNIESYQGLHCLSLQQVLDTTSGIVLVQILAHVRVEMPEYLGQMWYQ